jgi:D-alanyl-D-alanine carboxypeptidase/D-alanyl-D-alanine-endopeptidase (penicillin-binding protein 4)
LLSSVALLGASVLGASWLTVRSVANAVSPLPDANVEIAGDAPVLSGRRVPLLLADEVRYVSFQRRLGELSAKLPKASCLTVDVEGRRIADKDSSLVLLPASNMKILVGVVALDVLGADHRFVTNIYGTMNGTTIVGDLVVVGSGDPGIASADYIASMRFPSRHATPAEEFVSAMTDLQVTEVTGSIIGVETRYDLERYAPSLGLGIRGTEVGPLGALMINDGAVTGDPIKPDQPAVAAARQIYDMYTRAGIVVRGGFRTSTTVPTQDPLATIESPPLEQILVDLLANSDNNTAELLLKEIGFVKKGEGSREAGIAVVRETLLGWDIDVSGLTMLDGAGLERGNLLPCDLLSAVLSRTGAFGPIGNALAVAGESGTLIGVFNGTPAKGRLLGKTGTLSGAKALAGFVPYSAEESVSYVLILNGPSVANQSYYRPLWYELGEILTDFTGRPTPLEIAPFSE